MEFQWPFMLWLLLVVPVLIVAYLWARRQRQRFTIRCATLSFVKEALRKGPGFRRHMPPLLFLIGLTILLVALARPMTVVKVPSWEGTVILTMDTSGSMQADDIHPTRMEAAKTAAIAFVKQESSTARIGVVSFSDNASLVQSPTADQNAVIAAISRLSPQNGTAIGSGLQESLRAILEPSASSGLALFRGLGPSFGGIDAANGGSAFSNVDPSAASAVVPTPMAQGVYIPAIVILLTDGENNQGPDPADVAQRAAWYGVRIYTVGIGSPQGSILHIQGNTIQTRLDEDKLKQVAETANGAYYNALNANELQSIYNSLGAWLALKKEKTEITAHLTGLGAAFLFIGGVLSLFWFHRLI